MATNIFWPSESLTVAGAAQVPGNTSLPAASRRLPGAFLKQNLSRVAKPVTETIQPDVGPVRVWRRSTQRIYVLSGRMLVTDAQVALLETFYHTTLASGTKRFNWVDPYDQTTAVEMLFTQAPTASPSTGEDHSIATLDLEMYSG